MVSLYCLCTSSRVTLLQVGTTRDKMFGPLQLAHLLRGLLRKALAAGTSVGEVDNFLDPSYSLLTPC